VLHLSFRAIALRILVVTVAISWLSRNQNGYVAISLATTYGTGRRQSIMRTQTVQGKEEGEKSILFTNSHKLYSATSSSICEMKLDVASLIAPMVATHQSGANQGLKWRLDQLNALMLMITEREEDFIDALYQDLHKERSESLYTELILVKHEIQKFQKELSGWMKPREVPCPGAVAPAFCEIRSVPLSEPGCLIIAPFNYPVCISLLPVVGAFGGEST